MSVGRLTEEEINQYLEKRWGEMCIRSMCTPTQKTIPTVKSVGTKVTVDDLNESAKTNNEYTYEILNETADWLLRQVTIRPKLAIVCGSGLGGLGERITEKKVFAYKDIPNFPQSTGVKGHKGNLIFGKLNGVEVVCMQGRIHPYEGYSIAKSTIPIKIMKLIGVKTIILTNAAGGVNLDYEVGDLMIIKDHLALPLWTLNHPLVGENDERFGPRFPPTNHLYNKELRDLFSEVAKDYNLRVKNEELKATIREGVYTMYAGPSYETVSEIRALRMLGGDATGMSTAHEAVVAGYCGMQVFALSLITNKCVDVYDSKYAPNHQEVEEIAEVKASVIETLVTRFVSLIPKSFL